MLIKSGLFLFLMTVLQISARYKNAEPVFNENEINSASAVVSSSASRVSGWEAQPGQLPHHAFIRMVSPAGDLGRCGGAIVSKQWVITTAQCTTGQVSLVVRVGVLSFSNNNPENIFETPEWYHHPKYNNISSTLQTNNIALVKLQRPAVYTRLLQPIRVQSSVEAYRDYDGEQVYASGPDFTASDALTDVLRWVYLRTISNSACARIFPSSFVTDTTICARFINIASQSFCGFVYGGGAPLVHVGSDGVPTLIGVFSFMRIDCASGSPTGFVRPGPYLPWFKEVTGIDFENLQEDEDGTITPTTSTTTTPSTSTTTTPSTTTTTTPSTSTTTTPYISTTSTTTTMTTESEEPEPEDFTPEENTTAPPEDSEDKEDEEEDDSDCSESNEDDEMAQLLKRLEVNVKVKVGFNKYMSKDVGKDISV